MISWVCYNVKLKSSKAHNLVRCVPTLWRLEKSFPLVDLGHRLAVAQFAASTRKIKSFFLGKVKCNVNLPIIETNQKIKLKTI